MDKDFVCLNYIRHDDFSETDCKFLLKIIYRRVCSLNYPTKVRSNGNISRLYGVPSSILVEAYKSYGVDRTAWEVTISIQFW